VSCADDGQPTALVPMTEEQEDAMESSSFQDLLRHCGLHSPSSEQVTRLLLLEYVIKIHNWSTRQ